MTFFGGHSVVALCYENEGDMWTIMSSKMCKKDEFYAFSSLKLEVKNLYSDDDANATRLTHSDGAGVQQCLQRAGFIVASDLLH